ncbi:MAG TPA: ABC transporter ATP-binding protein [Tenuifilaceae bacterium]|jgi:peptide/nickel transport system ATP-binding protein|nr:ABC transporter ATP-binding protein [Bacteroidales bacterium]HNY08326.1 ABC transporter ATP-binding protein [Tenuifilaceae bacterium]MBP8644356.1 ABC transporter ATP-binding protein [Bacteroidales bacterium]NLI86726.1 ABC transporter ATP-binding protein [Bacteroidales bacterium]HOA10490.1 ABC transporter ATP-binding protein [Tenuifilaceae bacterium]
MLKVDNLSVAFGQSMAVNGINFSLEGNQILGIVGESGSGKSVTSLSIMGLLPKNARITNGSIWFEPPGCIPVNLVGINPEQHRQLRGKSIAMIFQEPHTCLNPSMRCGVQLVEALELHAGLKGKPAVKQCLSLLSEMQLPDPETISRSYPHQLSGGQKQRVMIAMALAGKPKLLIADEPTTALDVTVQKGILELLLSLRNRYGMGIIFISHDLSVVEQVADRVLVMRNGMMVEEGKAEDILQKPQHPYTRELIGFRREIYSPGNSSKTRNEGGGVVFSVNSLTVRYEKSNRLSAGKAKNQIRAVSNVSFSIHEGETLGLVGESGSGKSTIGRTLLRLIGNYSGQIAYKGKPLNGFTTQQLKEFRREVQLIFQDPYSSLNPRLTIGQALVEPVVVHGLAGKNEAKSRVLELLDRVKLPADSFYRFPHEFSGGQRQRLVIARALTLQPKVLICDEIISALDIAIQVQILNLLEELKRDFNLTYLFISHDLGVVRHISNRVIVLKEGTIDEEGPAEAIFAQPKSTYTKTLIAAMPQLLA